MRKHFSSSSSNKSEFKLKLSESSVYVEGLPSEITKTEVAEYFQKCGLVFRELPLDGSLQTDGGGGGGEYKVKIYNQSEESEETVAALVTYYRVESVQLALDLLDGSVLKYKDEKEYELKVTKADYTKSQSSKDATSSTSNTSNPSEQTQTKRKMTKAELKKQVQFIQRQLDWNEYYGDDDDIKKKKKKLFLILKSLFSRKDLEKNPELLLEIKEDVWKECEKYGKVSSVLVSEDEVVYVRFNSSSSGSNVEDVIEKCIKVFNGRYFDGRIVEAFSGYDKINKSQEVNVEEDNDDEELRLKRYSEYLNNLQDSYDDDEEERKDVKRIRT